MTSLKRCGSASIADSSAALICRRDQSLLRIRRAGLPRGGRLDELCIVGQQDGLGAVPGEPGERRIANDRQHPGAGPLDSAAIKRGKRSHAGVLHDILGVATISGQPSGQPIGVVEMGQHHLGETRLRRLDRSQRPRRSWRDDDLACHMRVKAAEIGRSRRVCRM